LVYKVQMVNNLHGDSDDDGEQKVERVLVRCGFCGLTSRSGIGVLIGAGKV
jgi:hypothetical protein